jgi:4-hydroxy-tetrahydrodipicolinate reductase
MNIALVGYGKMGHMIEVEAVKRGVGIASTIDLYAEDASCRIKSSDDLADAVIASKADAVIEFTHPDAVLNNIASLVTTGIPVIVGTTGWLKNLDYVKTLVEKHNSCLFYAANYSIGVNLFYKIVKEAGALFSQYDEYDTAIWEAHHTQKADSPSGTALDIAKHLMSVYPKKTEIVPDAFHATPKSHELHVSSTRFGSEPGTHTVFFDSKADTIELTHRARSREGFAVGAVRAAQWMVEQLNSKNISKGNLYTMENML